MLLWPFEVFMTYKISCLTYAAVPLKQLFILNLMFDFFQIFPKWVRFTHTYYRSKSEQKLFETNVYSFPLKKEVIAFAEQE